MELLGGVRISCSALMHTKKWRLNKGSNKTTCKPGYALEYEIENLSDDWLDGNPTRVRPKWVKIEGGELGDVEL